MFAFLIYVLFAALDLPIIVGGERGLPALIRQIHEALVAAFPRSGSSIGRARAEYLTVVAFTQIMPLIVLTSRDFSTPIQIGSVVELAIATIWTAFLVRGGLRSR